MERHLDHRSSIAASDTTYHSFNDIELSEPAAPSTYYDASSFHDAAIHTDQPHYSEHCREQDHYYSAYQDPFHSHDEKKSSRPTTAVKMVRQDSGYESHSSTPRTSISHSRPSVSRRISSASTSAGRPRTRPTTRRSAKTFYHQSQVQQQPVYLVRPDHPAHDSSSYFHFPSPEPVTSSTDTFDSNMSPMQHPLHHLQRLPTQTPPPPQPPQTTHYWTSDSTRRLEYAAIDAASRGFKGWLRRNLVPGCLVASEDKHLAFDDDTGSVRRYRLELEDEPAPMMACRPCDEEKLEAQRRRKTWQFWEGRKQSF